MKKLILFIIILITLSTTFINSISLGVGRLQSAGVRGKLTCFGKPAARVLVKLYDDDRGVDADDLLDKGKTNINGEFELKGSTSEFTTIDPKLNVYHDCNDNKPCQRKVTIMIPDKYVSSGGTPKELYNLGVYELSGKTKGESRDCLN